MRERERVGVRALGGAEAWSSDGRGRGGVHGRAISCEAVAGFLFCSRSKMTSDSAHKRRRHRCRGRTRAALVLALCICGALACGMLWVYVVFWWGNTESVRLYVTARGHVIQEHLETDAHSLLDQSLHWCHFAVQPTLFMLSSPGSVFLVFELAACERANKRADVHITFNPPLGPGVVCAGGVGRTTAATHPGVLRKIV